MPTQVDKAVNVRKRAALAIAQGSMTDMTTKIDGCQMEIDEERGTVYVRGPDGITLLRVSKIPEYGLKGLIDVTDWRWKDTKAKGA